MSKKTGLSKGEIKNFLLMISNLILYGFRAVGNNKMRAELLRLKVGG